MPTDKSLQSLQPLQLYHSTRGRHNKHPRGTTLSLREAHHNLQLNKRQCHRTRWSKTMLNNNVNKLQHQARLLRIVTHCTQPQTRADCMMRCVGMSPHNSWPISRRAWHPQESQYRRLQHRQWLSHTHKQWHSHTHTHTYNTPIHTRCPTKCPCRRQPHTNYPHTQRRSNNDHRKPKCPKDHRGLRRLRNPRSRQQAPLSAIPSYSRLRP